MKFLPNSVTRTLSRQLLQVKKQSPHIFFGLGIIGTVASTVLACRATLKFSDTLDEIQKDIDNVKGLKEDINNGTEIIYPADQFENDMVYVYTKAGLKILRLYGPAIVVGTASIVALTSSHVQLARQNTALMAAYAAVSKAYNDYRDRVREMVGEQKELDIYHAARDEIIKNKDDNFEEVKKVDPNTWSPYAKFFDEVSVHWEKDPELNRLFIQCQQNYANNLLHSRGHVFLNEVYDMLDIERTRAGSVVGWIISKDGDNYVDFGLYEAMNAQFINGRERSILLDFNVDGVIYDKIE